MSESPSKVPGGGASLNPRRVDWAWSTRVETPSGEIVDTNGHADPAPDAAAKSLAKT